ncbi:MAG: hypothetical protein IJ561_08150, partial [Ruminococcus sp.]|nr:hypothetical protein [Ruminococcus sp.]
PRRKIKSVGSLSNTEGEFFCSITKSVNELLHGNQFLSIRRKSGIPPAAGGEEYPFSAPPNCRAAAIWQKQLTKIDFRGAFGERVDFSALMWYNKI